MFLALAAVSSNLHGQATVETRRGSATRAGLDSLLGQLDAAQRSPAYSDELRDEAAREAGRIRARLDSGDFRVGDRIFLTVEGEQTLTDSFPVIEGPALNLPEIGRIALKGVLRSELNDHLVREIGRYVRDPRVRTRTLIRLLFSGAIRQGFYSVPTNVPFTDAMMIAGGPTADAKLTGIRIERDGHPIWDGSRLQDAIIEGQTLDQMNLQAGDQIIIPNRPHGLGNLESPLRAFMILLSIPAGILGTIAVF